MSEKIVFCRGGGCTAKLGAGVLERVLSMLPKGAADQALLVGFESSDDAAVYQVSEDLAIVQTLDFFPPMVEDPYIFGKIAAANAMSDVYAMGGTVKTALNIVCFPEQADLNILGAILQGGAEKVNEAGGRLAGGHSIADSEVKYGLSVMGFVHPKKFYRNNGGCPGDKLILTKKLGVGIICTAARVGAASAEALAEAQESMMMLNRYASEILREYEVHACTDVTGFGLLVHLHEMLAGKLSCCLFCREIPVIREAFAQADEFLLTAAAQRNRNHIGSRADLGAVSFAMQEVLFDPQTSGGLLAAVRPDQAEEAVRRLRDAGLPAAVIGELREKETFEIIAEM